MTSPLGRGPASGGAAMPRPRRHSSIEEADMNAKSFETRRERARSRPRRPGLEPLEDRRLLSTIVALTEQDQLLSFDSGAPGVILGTASIGGLQPGESVLGIDVRPA